MEYLYKDYRTPNTFDYDAQAINNAIRNILLTPLGSLPGKPSFGSRLYQIPFSQLDHITIDLLKKIIEEAIRKWETRIQIISIEIESAEAYNKIIATINYTYTDQELNRASQLSLSLM